MKPTRDGEGVARLQPPRTFLEPSESNMERDKVELAYLQKLYGDKSEQYVAERLAHEETRAQLSQALRELGEARATYPKPVNGWTCFHCGETFTNEGAARDHFGKTPDAEAGCLIRVQLGDERGLLMALRKAEDQLGRYQDKDLIAQRDAALHSAAELRGALEAVREADSDGDSTAVQAIVRTALASSSTKET